MRLYLFQIKRPYIAAQDSKKIQYKYYKFRGNIFLDKKRLGYQCTELSKYTGFKEMLDGRVKTYTKNSRRNSSR